MKRRLCWLGLAALAIGAFVLVYRGPGRAIVRGHGGDVAATMLVYALLGLAWRARPVVRALATMAIATAIELGQTFWHARSFAGELLVGSTFDAIDFVAYAIGVAIAVGVELARRPRFRVGYRRRHADVPAGRSSLNAQPVRTSGSMVDIGIRTHAPE